MNRRRSSVRSYPSCIWFKKSSTRKQKSNMTFKNKKRTKSGKNCKLRLKNCWLRTNGNAKRLRIKLGRTLMSLRTKIKKN